MTDNIYKQNVYSLKEQMWHSKGYVSQVEETAEIAYGHMEEVIYEQRPFSIVLNGELLESKDFGIVRMSGGKEVLIGHTRGRYSLIQPVEYFQLFDENVKVPVETIGFLGTNAEKLFTSWCLPDIDIHGDVHKLFGMLHVGFDGKYGEHLYIADVRPICANTVAMAIGDSESTNNHGRGSLYSGKHNNDNHKRDLGIWMSYIQRDAEKNVEMIKSLFCKMDSVPLNSDNAYSLFSKIYSVDDIVPDFYPDELRDEKQGKIDDKKETAQERVDLAMNLFQGAGIEIAKNCYGAFNCVTEAENHHVTAKKDRVNSILFGGSALIMNKATSVIGDYANQYAVVR
jgi:hypothetical protein